MYNSPKVIWILGRSNLTLEQRVCGLNSLARHSVNLLNDYQVTIEDLRALSFREAVKILRKTRSYTRIYLDDNVTVKEVELFLFPLMIKDYQKYTELIEPLKHRIFNRDLRVARGENK